MDGPDDRVSLFCDFHMWQEKSSAERIAVKALLLRTAEKKKLS
jgi:hypothetical protein